MDGPSLQDFQHVLRRSAIDLGKACSRVFALLCGQLCFRYLCGLCVL